MRQVGQLSNMLCKFSEGPTVYMYKFATHVIAGIHQDSESAHLTITAFAHLHPLQQLHSGLHIVAIPHAIYCCASGSG